MKKSDYGLCFVGISILTALLFFFDGGRAGVERFWISAVVVALAIYAAVCLIQHFFRTVSETKNERMWYLSPSIWVTVLAAFGFVAVGDQIMAAISVVVGRAIFLIATIIIFMVASSAIGHRDEISRLARWTVAKARQTVAYRQVTVK